ncbi:MAG: helix-turn-helix domain-containing protein [Prevotella sp.]|jgi:DNA-binding transcriptional regulator YiaG|nr:helix-turn-helix domain-containing protein [Prevotella sp.]
MKMETESELCKLRKGFKLTKTQSAKLLKVNPKTWARWEKGETKMPEAQSKLFELKANGIKELIAIPNTITPSMITTRRGELTKAEAARLIGVTVGAWRRYETGARRMRRGLYEFFLRQLQLTRKKE